MKRVGVFVIVIGCLVPAAWAQQTRGKDNANHGKPVYYDTFKEKWLDPTKWLATGPYCSRTLECVREIQNHHLRLAVRNLGAIDSDSGAQYDQSGLYFVDPNTVKNISADVVIRSFTGVGCSTNSTDVTHTEVRIGGTYFNTGTGDPAGDTWAYLILWVGTSNTQTINVGNWWAWRDQGSWTTVGSYPVGTPLTATFAWDKANHQFIATVQVKDEPGSRVQVVALYQFLRLRSRRLPIRTSTPTRPA